MTMSSRSARRLVTRLVALLPFLAIVACTDSTGPAFPGALLVQVEGRRVLVTNQTGRTVFLRIFSDREAMLGIWEFCAIAPGCGALAPDSTRVSTRAAGDAEVNVSWWFARRGWGGTVRPGGVRSVRIAL